MIRMHRRKGQFASAKQIAEELGDQDFNSGSQGLHQAAVYGPTLVSCSIFISVFLFYMGLFNK